MSGISIRSGQIQLRGKDGVLVDVNDNSHGLVTMDVFHHNIHEGNAYITGHYFSSINNGDNADVLIVNGKHECNIEATATCQGDMLIFLYKNTIVTSNGTAVDVMNLNDNSVKQADALFYHTPTISSVGEMWHPQSYIPGGKQGSFSGADSSERHEFVLKRGGSYLIRAQNQSGTPSKMSIDIQFYLN